MDEYSILGLADATQRPNLHYDLIEPETGRKFSCPPDTGWRYSRETMNEKIEDNRIIFPKSDTGRPREKKFLAESKNEFTGFSSILSENVGFTLNGTREVRNIFNNKFFSFPKPISLLKTLIAQVKLNSDDIILDFFAGSGTTAHAVMQLNAEGQNGSRRYICVQLPEKTGEKSEARKGGYPTIFDITKARIEKAAAKIRAEHPDYTGDLGFKIFQTVDNFRQHPDKDFSPEQPDLPLNDDLSEEQLQTLLTTWRCMTGRH